MTQRKNETKEQHHQRVYERYRRRIEQGLCGVGGCKNPREGMSLCPKHLALARKSGRESGRRHAERRKEYGKEWYHQRVAAGLCVRGDNRPAAPGRVMCQHHIDISKRSQLKYFYGITVEQFDQMVEKQAGRCVICDKKAKLSVDHHHDTRVVNALLCHKCNSAIGLLGHDFQTVRRALEYIQRYYLQFAAPTS